MSAQPPPELDIVAFVDSLTGPKPFIVNGDPWLSYARSTLIEHMQWIYNQGKLVGMGKATRDVAVLAHQLVEEVSALVAKKAQP